MLTCARFAFVLVSLAPVACSSAPQGKAGPKLPPPGKLGILLRGIDAGRLQRVAASIREVEGRDIVVVDDRTKLKALEACTNYRCRSEIARSLGLTHVVYGSLEKIGHKAVRARLATVLVATPDGWSTNNLTFSATGFEMRVCEVLLADARIYAQPLSSTTPRVEASSGPFGACHSKAARSAPLPAVEWHASAALVPSRLRELDAWYDEAGVDADNPSPDARTLKAYLAKKPDAPFWVERTTWLEKTDKGEVLFAVGKHFVQPGVPAENGIDAAEKNAIERAAGALPTDAPSSVVRAVDYYSEGTGVFALVTVTEPAK